ncbi:MAG: hypothetical protein WBJ17_00325 [Natronincolaceae bacterium]|jgi:predicted nucleotidyltransferase
MNDYVLNLKKQIPVEKVIIFGSYAKKGTAHKYSNVHIAVFSDYFKGMSRVDSIYFLLINAVDYDIDLEPQGFTMEEYNESAGLVSEIIKTGVELM